jgi:hypothetical protein
VIDAGFSEAIMITLKNGLAVAAIALTLPMAAISSSHAAPLAGLGIGLAAGALIGGAIAAGSAPGYYGPGYYAPPPAYYVQPAPVYGGDAVAYCMQRYRSYDPASGTYLNYDGNRYPCP